MKRGASGTLDNSREECYYAGINRSAVDRPPPARGAKPTLHIHTHLRLQVTWKLEVEGCHLWLSRQ